MALYRNGGIPGLTSDGAGRVTVTYTTAATSGTTGALVVNGGLGVKGAIYSDDNVVAPIIAATQSMSAPYGFFTALGFDSSAAGAGKGLQFNGIVPNGANALSLGNNGPGVMAATPRGWFRIHADGINGVVPFWQVN